MDKNESRSATVQDFESATAHRPRGARDAVAAIDRWLLGKVMRLAGQPPFSVALWDGQVAWHSHGPPVATVRISDRRALVGLIINPERLFGEYYTAHRVDVDGSLVEFMQALYASKNRIYPPGSWYRDLNAWINRPRPNTLDDARSNIHSHYDIGNDFYGLWLDERLVYTCAYFETPGMTLDDAQTAKLDHVCRKLQLDTGMTVVEAGCGWGALALHMAGHYGVKVRAFNISHQQVEFARERARREGLADRVEFVEDDYRNIQGSFDGFVSVGMLEHVGTDNYGELGAVMKRSLRPGGRGLLHSIGRNYPDINNAWIERRIFPGSRPPALSEMMQIFEPHGFSVIDVENLRLHYARTCREWLCRFERVSDKVEDMYDEPFVRAWRLYLSGSVAAFAVGTMQLFQVVFAHQDDNDLPMTRRHVYPELVV